MTRRAIACFAALVLLAACNSGNDRSSAPAPSGPASSAPDPTAAPTTSTTAAVAGYHSDVYATPDYWICRPELATDPCHTSSDLDTTIVRADGTTEVVAHKMAADPGIDCFYVYPTVNLGAEGNAPRDGEPSGVELGAAHNQAGPFNGVCRLFAPRYRQVTLAAYARQDAHAIALADVVDAFKHYMANDNGGRGVVLLGHSQGSMVLDKLIKAVVDNDATMRDRLVSAVLIGANVRVADSSGAGADFTHVPPCTQETQTGCVVAYSAFRASAPPPPNAFFSRVRSGPGEILCTNPAVLGGGAHELDSIFTGTRAFSPTATPAPAPITTGRFATPGLISGECVERDGAHYLEITVHGDPADPRIDDIGGDLTPQWGLHSVDMPVAMGDLVHLVSTQSATWLADHGQK